MAREKGGSNRNGMGNSNKQGNWQMRKEKMKEREDIICNKGSGHEIRENCLRVTSFRDTVSSLSSPYVLSTYLPLIFSLILVGNGSAVIISMKRIIAQVALINQQTIFASLILLYDPRSCTNLPFLVSFLN